jgi:acetyltransferase
MVDPRLEGIVDPKSIAIIGASQDPRKLGNQCLTNILIGGYKGKVYPVNPKSKEILGLKCYPSIKDIGEKVDVALIFVPANKVAEVLSDCAVKQVNLIVLITAGFSEIGNFEQEKKVVNICKENNMRLIGPNVIGISSPLKDCNATFGASKMPYKGKIALVTQSGALALALSDWTHIDKVGLSSLISIGNMGDVNFSDSIEFFMEHPETNCLTFYMEGVKDGRRFFENAKKLSKKKPIVVLKAGESYRGKEAIATHTGSLAGANEIYKAAFKQTGIIQVENLEEMFNFSLALSSQPPMRGKNCIILTNGGGSGILAVDTAERCGLLVQDLSEELKEELKKCVPSYGSLNNPIDLTGMATEREYEGALRALIQSEEVDGIGILFCHTAIADPLKIAHAIAIVSKDSKKPLVCTFLGSSICRNAMDFLKERGIPAYPSPEKCIRALGALQKYGENLRRKIKGFKKKEDVDREKAQKIVEDSKEKKAKLILEPEAERILKCYGIPTSDEALAKSKEEALTIGKMLGFPVAMKIVSKDIVHKADAKCVKVNVAEEKAQDVFEELICNARNYKESVKIEGVLVQQMAPQGKELIVGSFKDPQFGPCVMLGLGGIFVEALKDVTFRVAPITTQEASEMIQELKSYPILKGLRGEPPIDFDVLREILSRLSQLAYEFQEIKAIDANPIFVYEKGAIVADARIILE